MMPLLKQLEEQARTLCPEDRARLAEIMLESLQPSTIEINSACDEEIERRLDADRQSKRTHMSSNQCAFASRAASTVPGSSLTPGGGAQTAAQAA